MKKWIFLFLIIATNVMAAKNWALQGAIPKAREQVLKIERVTEADWDSFLRYIQPTLASASGKDEDGYTAWLVTEFDKWKSNDMIHRDDEAFADEDVRKQFDPSAYSSSTMASPPRSVGRGSVVSASTLSTRVFGGAGSGIARTEACMTELKNLRRAFDLTTSEARQNLRDRLEAIPTSVQETLKELLSSDTLRASYIRVLLNDTNPAHRKEVLDAINSADHAAFRGALIQSLLANAATRKEVLDALHGAHSGEMINAIHGGAHRKEMIDKLHEDAGSRGEVVAHLSTNHAGDMVAKVVADHRPAVIAALVPAHIDDLTPLLGTNEAFRAAVITRLEAGHFAINATRMLWHPIDGAGAAFWASSTATPPQKVVTQVAIDDAKETIRRAYQTMGSGLVTNPRKSLRKAILGPQTGGGARNQIGIKYRHLKEGDAHNAPFYTETGALNDPGDVRPAD